MTGKKIVNGIEFDSNTPERVVNILLTYMGSKQRIRLFYGDSKTGRDYGETYDVMGYIGRSTGQVKIPLLINNSRSMGGMGILTGSIVRITVDKRNIYVHPKYKCDVTVKGKDVYLNGKLHISSPTIDKAKKAADFLSGRANAF